MLGKLFRARFILGLPVMLAILVVAAACAASDTPTPIVVEKEVIKEIEVPVIVEKEVIKEIEVPVIVEKEVIREIEVPVVVEKEVIKIVEVESIATPTQVFGAFNSYLYTGAAPTKFNESPTNAGLVKQGKLPPVKQRVSDEPLVLIGPDGVGKYNGERTFRLISCCGDTNPIAAPALGSGYLLQFSLDGNTIEPNLVKAWRASSDFNTWTMELRKGTKWSDGTPFTAEDVSFSFKEFVTGQDEGGQIQAATRAYWKTGGEMAKFNKIDDTTFSFSFTTRFPKLMEYQTYYFGKQLFSPKHYTGQFHPDYSTKSESQLNREAEAAGFDEWTRYIARIGGEKGWLWNPDMPHLGPYVSDGTVLFKDPLFRMKANPYFWQVDGAGNQIPYVQKSVFQVFNDGEILNLHAIAGEFDFARRSIDAAKLTLFVLNADKQNYRVILKPSHDTLAIHVNTTYGWPGKFGDAVLGDLLRDFEFRKAISMAINRDKITEVIFSGLGTPRHAVPGPLTAYHPGTAYESENPLIQFDPDEANRLLDGLGLDKKNAEGFRLRPDGKVLEIRLRPFGLDFINPVGELVVEDLEAVGLRMLLYTGGAPSEKNDFILSLYRVRGDPWTDGRYNPSFQPSFQAQEVARWYQTDGAEGLNPYTTPGKIMEDMAKLIDLYDQGNTETLAEREGTGAMLGMINADNLYIIGVVGLTSHHGGLMMVNKDVRGFPEGPVSWRENKALFWFN